MTKPHKPAEDIGMRDVLNRMPEPPAANLNAHGPGVYQLKINKNRPIAFDQHPALTALKRLAEEFRKAQADSGFRADQIRGFPQKQILGDDYYTIQRQADIYKDCAARLEQAIREIEG